MRILFLSQVFPDTRNPVRGTFNLSLCRALSLQHDVRVISPRPWTEALSLRWRGEGVFQAGEILDNCEIKAHYPTYWYLPRVALHRTAKGMLRGIRKDFLKILEEFEPEAILSYWAHPEGRVGLELGREMEIPSACIVGGSDVLLLPRQSRRRGREIMRVMTESDAIFTVSDGLRNACIQLGAPAGKVRTIYQGIDRSRFFARDRGNSRRKLHIPTGVMTYLWVGRMVKLKRLDLALEAVAKLHHGGKRVKLYLIGDGPDRERIREYAEILGIPSAIDFVGAISPDQLAEWYSAVDATILCSDSEGLPNVLRESLACGTPFVATDVGSIREFALPACARMVPAGDADALAAAMLDILSPEYRIAAELHRPRTWTDCAHEMADVLDSMTRRRQALQAEVESCLNRKPVESFASRPVVATPAGAVPGTASPEPEAGLPEPLPQQPVAVQSSQSQTPAQSQTQTGPAMSAGAATAPVEAAEDLMALLNRRLQSSTFPREEG